MIYLLVTVFFVLLQAFYSGIETGLISLQRPRVKLGLKQKIKAAKILDFFMKRPAYMISTCLVGTNICVVCASIMAKKTAAEFGCGDGKWLFIITSLMTIFLLTAEIIPKDWFRQSPYERCMFFSRFFHLSYKLLFVPVIAISTFTKIIDAIFSSGKKQDHLAVASAMMREDFRLLLRDSENAGIIDSEAADILDKSVDFYASRVSEISVKKENVYDLPSNTLIKDAVAFCQKYDLARTPVRRSAGDEEEASQWIGVFSVYDAIFNMSEDFWDDMTIANCLRPITNISASADLNEILVKTKRSRVHSPLLIVVDTSDHSRQVGVVSANDLVKKLFE